jgi:hypothetical protein
MSRERKRERKREKEREKGFNNDRIKKNIEEGGLVYFFY